MKMRTFIHVKPPNMSVKTAHHARYISERERDPEREEPQSRPIFTHDRNGLKYTAADRYLAGGTQARAKTRDLQHIIIAFNSHDARELEKLGSARSAALKDQSSKSEDGPARQESSNLEDSKLALVERDKPFAEAVRRMMEAVEERTDLSELRYALTVHRHTTKTHVHLLLRREYRSKESGEKARLGRHLPEEFLNGRDEQGKAIAGILDIALSDSLDTMIPQRHRPARTEASTKPEAPQPEEERNLHILNFEHDALENSPRARAEQSPPERRPKRLNFSVRKSGHHRPTVSPHLRDATRQQPAQTLPPRNTPTSDPAPSHEQTTESARQIEEARARAALLHSPRTSSSNLQNLNPNLQPILQDLKIEDGQTEPREHSKSGVKKNISGLKTDPYSPSASKPAHISPETPINSQLSDRSSQPQPQGNKQRSSASRGR